MKNRLIQLPIFFASLCFGVLNAQIVTNPARPIANRVFINPIISQKSDGTRAVHFGDAAQKKNIEDSVTQILSQAGIEAHFLPEVTWVSDFAYDATPNTPATGASRPQSDLNTMLAAPGAPTFSDAEVINMFFVKIVPGFELLGSYYSNGLAGVDYNGISMHVGADLVTFQNGRDAVAKVVAHEIGHNLGLPHTANSSANLMSPGGTTAQLTEAQITAVFTNNSGVDGFDLAKVIPAPTASFSRWFSENSLTGSATSDQDGDGLSNFFEFCYGLDPRKKDGDRFRPLQPPLSGPFTVDFRKQPNATEAGVVYSVQSSTSLTGWLNQGQAGSGMTSLLNDSETLRVRLETSASVPRFYRYSVNTSVAASLQSAPPVAKRAQATVVEIPAAPARYSDCNVHGCGCITVKEQ